MLLNLESRRAVCRSPGRSGSWCGAVAGVPTAHVEEKDVAERAEFVGCRGVLSKVFGRKCLVLQHGQLFNAEVALGKRVRFRQMLPQQLAGFKRNAARGARGLDEGANVISCSSISAVNLFKRV